MILADTSGIFAVINRKDRHHEVSKKWFRSTTASGEALAITQPLLTESWRLINARIGPDQADTFWNSVLKGLFILIDIDVTDLRLAMEIRTKYADSGIGFVDATSFAICERHRISRAFTFDWKHFGIYRPTFADCLELVPAAGS